MRDNEEIMNGLRTELKRAVQQRFKRIDIDRFKAELKDHVTHYLFEKTQHSPIVIPVLNIIGGAGKAESHQNSNPNAASANANSNQPNQNNNQPPKIKSAEEVAAEQQKRFQEMRARLLTQDAAID